MSIRVIDTAETYVRKTVYKRLKLYQDEAAYHEAQAANERAKAALLIHTWQLCPKFGSGEDGFCCNDPVNCQGRQP